MGSDGPSAQFEPDIKRLLKTSEYFVCNRNFEDARKYAVEALKANPKHPGPPHLLAIITILSGFPSALRTEPPDWYSVLDLPRFTRDPNVIRARLDLMKDLLNPDKNPYPFAAEAREWVFKAGFVLSNPNMKSQFDRELRGKRKDAGEEGGTFWTVCPYCYFMYEYESVFENCALRCQNVKCRKAYTAVAVAASEEPTPEVVEKGKYYCDVFAPLVTNNAKNGEYKGWKWWKPFVSMGSGRRDLDTEEARTKVGPKTKTEKTNDIIDLTEDGGTAVGEEIKKRGDVDVVHGGNVVAKRKKEAAKGRKKVTGKGIRAKWNPSLPGKLGEGMESKAEENGDGAKTGGENVGCGGVGLEFSAEYFCFPEFC